MKTRILVDFTISFLTPFHIGSGYARGILDRTVLRNSSGHLYIPGSTLKGNMRHEAERIAGLLGIEHCTPHVSDNLKCFGEESCLICRIFGNPRRQSGLYFDDAVLDEGERQLFHDANYLLAVERTRIKMNRKLGSAEYGALFTTEYGSSMLKFRSSISGTLLDITPIEGGPDFETILLLTSLRSLTRLGSDRSCGSGWVEVDITSSDNQEKDVIFKDGRKAKLDEFLAPEILEWLTLEKDIRKEVVTP